MAETVGAVSGTHSNFSASTASAKGSNSATVFQGSLGGSDSRGGLAYVIDAKHRDDTFQSVLTWSEMAAGVATIAAISAFINFEGLEMPVGALRAPETAGFSLGLVSAKPVEAAIASALLVAGAVGEVDGINRLKGKGIGE